MDKTSARHPMLLFVLFLCLAAVCQAVDIPPAMEGLPMLRGSWPSGADKFTFAVLGDKTSGGEGKWPIFDRAVDTINLLGPDFVISVGDQIPGHMQDKARWDAEWAEYMEHATRLRPTLIFTPGNHDIANIECYEFWKQDLGRTYYSFNHRGCHFLVLNTEEERFDGRGPVWQAMLEFAEKDLAAHADSRHTFVFFHKPMWEDPRYEEDWARIEAALAGRKYTVVAGHEHYLSTERRNGNLYVIQNATGGGIALSDVREYGSFHGFGYVTVDGDDVTYAILEPDGRAWPVDVAPASFRKAIGFELLTLDAKPAPQMTSATVRIRAMANLHNTLDKPVAVRATITGVAETGWTPVLHDEDVWKREDGGLVLLQELRPGERVTRPIEFDVPAARLPYPPSVRHEVRYDGEWLVNESLSMVQEDVVPIYPAAAVRIVPEWRLVGPFALGDIDTDKLPEDPAASNPNFFKRFGPEDGYDPDRVYQGGLRWFAAKNQGRGLLNFNALMGTQDHALGYALCGVFSPEAQTVHATVYSDNFHQVVLNGALVDEGQDFGAPSGFTYVPLELRAGWNTLIVKLINNHGDWFLRVLTADPAANLKFAPFPEEVP